MKTKKHDIHAWEEYDYKLIFTPGEFPVDTFVAACLDHDDGFIVKPEDVKYSVARYIPVWEDGKFSGHYLDWPVQRKRGAFTITYAEDYAEVVEEELEDFI